MASLGTLNGRGESLEGLRHDQLITGNLEIIRELYPGLSELMKAQLKKQLDYLLPRLLSDNNRRLAYGLRLMQN